MLRASHSHLKKIKTAAIFLIIILSIQSSCRKGQQDIPLTETNDSTFIASIIGLDSSGFNSDTAIRIYFSYDLNKRVSTILEEVYFRGTQNRSYSIEYRYIYDGTDTVPKTVFAKLTNYQFSPNSSNYDTAFLTYENGFISNDSTSEGGTIGGYHYYVFDFVRSSSQLYQLNFKDIGTTGTSSSSKRIFVNWNNGNLIQEIDSTYYSSSGVWSREVGNYLYDNKPNPLRKIFFKLPAYIFRRNFTLFTAMGPHILSGYWLNTTNNVIRDEYDAGGTPEVINWTYTYGTNGLPKTALRNAWGNYFKFFYQYTSL